MRHKKAAGNPLISSFFIKSKSFYISALLIILIGFWSYHNNLHGPFIFDDDFHIVNNPAIKHLNRPFVVVHHTSRPVVYLSLAANYHLGKLDTFGYHLFNIVTHILSAMCLWGILRRTLFTQTLHKNYRRRMSSIAWSIAVLWMVHPLNSESVNYIIQRSELLLGLFFFLTLYCFIRASGSRLPWGWFLASIFSCYAGVASKQVMVVAPVIILLYDRILLAASFREILTHRKFYYGGLLSSWIWLWVLMNQPSLFEQTIGFDLQQVSVLRYALTQTAVILHYLKLSIWPLHLCLDYYWPAVSNVSAISLPIIGMLVLIFTSFMTLRIMPAIGFLMLWILIILAPTSSIIPIADMAFEHRMYLPLAAIVTFMVLIIDKISRILHPSEQIQKYIFVLMVSIMIVISGNMTIRRNELYRSATGIWKDTVDKRPLNPRAHFNYAKSLFGENRPNKMDALKHYQEAIRLRPDYWEAYNNLGNIFVAQRQFEKALDLYNIAVNFRPQSAGVHYNIGFCLQSLGKEQDAMAEYQLAIQHRPSFTPSYNNLGSLLIKQGKWQEAEQLLRTALSIDPDFLDARKNLNYILSKKIKKN